jgi:hypothetical protein
MHKSSTKIGHMKKYGKVPPPPEWISPDDEREMYFWRLQHPDTAIYEVLPESESRVMRGNYGFDDFSYESSVKDHQLILGDVWNTATEKNASKGECTNTEIGIKYEYDLSGKWLHVISTALT